MTALIYSCCNIIPPLPAHITAKLGACLYDNLVQAGSASWRQSQSALSWHLTALDLHTASRPEWNGRKGQERPCMYPPFMHALQHSCKNFIIFIVWILHFGVARWQKKARRIVCPAESLIVKKNAWINTAIVPIGAVGGSSPHIKTAAGCMIMDQSVLINP